MREIKFRGKSVMTGDWIYGSYLLNSGGKAPLHQIVTCGGMIVKVDPDTVGQYTILKDKSGVEIYEGDIVNTDDGPAEVKYDVRVGLFMMEYRQHRITFFSYLNEPHEKFEVIDNVYENPEILGGDIDALHRTNL